MRHGLHARQQAPDRRTQDHAQLVGAFAQTPLHGNAPGTEGVVGVQHLLVVEEHLGERIQPLEHQFAARSSAHVPADLECGAVFPVRQADPLQARFRRTDIGVRNQAMGQQVGMHRAGHRGGTPCRPDAGRILVTRPGGYPPELPTLVQLPLFHRLRTGKHGEQRDGAERTQHEQAARSLDWRDRNGAGVHGGSSVGGRQARAIAPSMPRLHDREGAKLDRSNIDRFITPLTALHAAPQQPRCLRGRDGRARPPARPSRVAMPAVC